MTKKSEAAEKAKKMAEEVKRKKAKERNIKKETKRLSGLLKDIDPNKYSAAEGLILEASFMRATLTELKEDINTNGVSNEMEQGDYTILRESPSVKTYNTMIQRYTTVMKELVNLFPDGKEDPLNDGFDEFVQSRGS